MSEPASPIPEVRVVEHYADRSVGVGVADRIRVVLDSLPPESLRGLDAVILRDEKSLTTQEKRKGLADNYGAYVRSRSGRGPTEIHLFVDAIERDWPRWFRRLPILRYEIVHQMLFHELAHHLQDRETPGRRHHEPDVVRRGRELHRDSFRSRHRLPFLAFRVVYRCLDPFVRPWVLHRSSWDLDRRRAWFRKWLVRWTLGGTGGALVGAAGFLVRDEMLAAALKVVAVPALTVSLLGLLILLSGRPTSGTREGPS